MVFACTYYFAWKTICDPLLTLIFCESPLIQTEERKSFLPKLLLHRSLRLLNLACHRMIFPEIMAEMRRPRDFIKGMAMAQVLIFTCYVLYGCFVYAYQGQFTLAVAYQGVSKYSWQTVGTFQISSF